MAEQISWNFIVMLKIDSDEQADMLEKMLSALVRSGVDICINRPNPNSDEGC